MSASRFRNSRTFTILLGLAAGLIVVFIVLFPDQILKASLEGLTIWWKIVFPALLPFFIITEIMAALGIVHFLGVFLNPLMRRLFRLPGTAGWCLAMGWTAGSPAGAEQAAELRRTKQISRSQAERLLAVTHVGSPAFIVIVIAAGFFGDPWLGIPLLFIHWLAALTVAIFMRHSREPVNTDEAIVQAELQPRTALFRHSFKAMEQARNTDGRPFGKLLGDSVYLSIQKLMAIGGYMMIFSVLLKIGILSGISNLAAAAISGLFGWLGVSADLSMPLIYGIFEQHLGGFAIHQAAVVPGIASIALLCAVLGWSGLCIHAQVKISLQGTDIRYWPFAVARFMHAIVSAAIVLLAFPILRHFAPAIVQGFHTFGEARPAWTGGTAETAIFPVFSHMLMFSGLLLLLAFGLMAITAMASLAVNKR